MRFKPPKHQKQSTAALFPKNIDLKVWKSIREQGSKIQGSFSQLSALAIRLL